MPAEVEYLEPVHGVRIGLGIVREDLHDADRARIDAVLVDKTVGVVVELVDYIFRTRGGHGGIVAVAPNGLAAVGLDRVVVLIRVCAVAVGVLILAAAETVVVSVSV